MEIGLIYSSNDPQQAQTREFVENFIREHGILARVVKTERPVRAPTITIDGCAVNASDAPGEKQRNGFAAFPSREDITRALEKSIWCL